MKAQCLETSEVATPEAGRGGRVPSIRVLFNTPRAGLQGGPPTHLRALERALRELVDVHPYEYGRKTDTETILQKIFGRLGDLIRLWKLCRMLHPNLIHHNSAFDSLAILRDAPLLLLAKRQGIPVFLKVHGSWPEAFQKGHGIVSLARRVVLRNADCIGVLSPIEKAEFEKSFPHVQGRVRVVKNVINPEFAATPRREADRPTILFLSRLIRRKGPFDLLHAAPLVLAKEPRAEFLFVGDGEDADSFDREVVAMGLGHSVRRIPHVDNRECSTLYAKAWMLVFPTHFPEGMPMVVAEAMAAGVPIISTPTRFSKSYMIEGIHVLYSQSGDVGRLSANVLKLCSDNGLRERMCCASRGLALKVFATDSVVAEYASIYGKISKKTSLLENEN